MPASNHAIRVIRALLTQYADPIHEDLDESVILDLADFLASELQCDPITGRCPLADPDAVCAVITVPVGDFGLLSSITNDPARVNLTLSLLADDLWSALQTPDSFSFPDDQDDNEDQGYPPGHCELCTRGPMRLTFHHLIPRKTHAKMLKKGLFTKDEMHSRGAMVCRPCHNTIHRFFDHETLATERNTIEKLLEDDRVQRWVEYQSKQVVRQRMVSKMSGRAVARGSAEVVRVKMS
ncbi:hypothetical protein BCR44DRAFT_39274 [Catenaria anguillulae PL171]|uniref:HNH domain-containing protein n=1 Tax=Catenaria anguillulae PL171 TaxID=765915 RepID=A0A1Y2I486_9FUNG|nr:hypothetical protein BCR44DRAFT_39274 [Catenaria anguillulae PL171]